MTQKTIVGNAVIDEGRHTSIAIGTDDRPVISYFSDGASELKFVRCNNLVCDFAIENNTVDTTGFVGLDTSIAIGADGLPVISYYDLTNKELKVAHCGNTSCNGGNEITTVDNPDNNDVGRYTSIAIGVDDNPVISYFDNSANDLKVVHCHEPTCHDGFTIITLDRVENVGRYTSIAIGVDDNPVISYVADFNLGVAVVGPVLIFE